MARKPREGDIHFERKAATLTITQRELIEFLKKKDRPSFVDKFTLAHLTRQSKRAEHARAEKARLQTTPEWWPIVEEHAEKCIRKHPTWSNVAVARHAVKAVNKAVLADTIKKAVQVGTIRRII